MKLVSGVLERDALIGKKLPKKKKSKYDDRDAEEETQRSAGAAQDSVRK